MISKPPPASRYSQSRQILLCLREHIDEVLPAWPLLHALRGAAPQARITVLGARPATQLLERSPLVDRIATVQGLGVQSWGEPGGASASGRIGDFLDDAGPFDLVLDAGHAPAAVGAVLRQRGVATVEADADLQRAALARGDSVMAAVVAAAEAGWNLPVPRPLRCRLDLPTEHHVAVRSWLLRAGLNDCRLAALSPTTSHDLTRWPTDRLAALADELTHHVDRVLIIGGQADDTAQQVAAAMSHGSRATVVEAMHLLDTAALLKLCEVFVGDDPGLAHLAAAVDTPTIGLLDETMPRWRPSRPPKGASHPEATDARARRNPLEALAS